MSEEATETPATPEERTTPYDCTNCGWAAGGVYTDPARCNPWRCLRCGTWNTISASLAKKSAGKGFDGKPLPSQSGSVR